MSSPRDPNWRLRGFARRMRHEPTDAERKLWSRLRDRQLNGYKFRRQVPLEGYIADFFCLDARLIVEVDGSQHFAPEGKSYDGVRDETLRAAGHRIVRYTDLQVLNDTDLVLADVLQQLEEEPSPRPSPGVPGEGGV